MSEEFIADIIENSTAADVATADALAVDAAKTVAQVDVKVVSNVANDDVNDDVNGNKDVGNLDKSPDVSKKENVQKAVQSTVDSDLDNNNNPVATVEELATQLGWNKDHQGENAVNASTYILKSREIQDTMRGHNKDLKGQLTSLQSSVEALKDHNDRVYKTDVKKMQAEITDLKKQKREAVELADVAKVDSLDDQIDNIQKNINEPVPEQKPSGNPIYDDWIKDNSWYVTDPDMAKYADTVADQFRGAPLDRVYKIVRDKVAEVFPDKFESQASNNAVNNNIADQNVTKPVGPASPVEAAQNTKINSNTFTKADLTQDQLTIMNQFVSGGIMTEDQYITDIAKLQEA